MEGWEDKFLMPKKGYYAIELEIASKYKNEIINKYKNRYIILDKDNKTIIRNGKYKKYDSYKEWRETMIYYKKKKHISVFSESRRIIEFNIRTSNIYEKSIIYNQVGKITKNNCEFPIGSYSGVSGGTHLHLFLSKSGFKWAKNNFNTIKLKLFQFPLWMKIIKDKGNINFYNRERHFLLHDFFKENISYNKNHFLSLSLEHQSIEFRMNNIIHPFIFIYFYNILAFGQNSLNIKYIKNESQNLSSQLKTIKIKKMKPSIIFEDNIDIDNLINNFSIPTTIMTKKYIDEIKKDFIKNIPNVEN